MDPLSALSVASGVIQIVDFSAKVISRTREIYLSADGALEENSFLEDATANLSELSTELTEEIRQTVWGFRSKGSGFGRKSADEQLIQLAKDSRMVATNLLEKLDRVKRKKDGGKRNALNQGIRSILEQKEVSGLADRLDQIRKQVDTALLLSLRKRIGEIPELRKETTSALEYEKKAELLASLQDNDWKPTQKGEMVEFSNSLILAVDMDVEQRFFNMILARLYFSDLPDRYEAIPKAHQNTCEWIFEDDPQQIESCEWDSFTKWLSGTDGDNLYWIAGKPGSGKSTLMKYLFNDSRTSAQLQTWAAGRPLIQAGFFFWNSGTVMQMSRMGLLRSILHSSLSNDKKTVMQIFNHRWQKFVAFGGGRQTFTWSELVQAFEALIAPSETPKTFFFVVDGLDEFDGDHKELVHLFLNAAEYPHVKACVASRPWLVFADSFEDRPCLLLERLTKKDIHHYVTSAFNNNKHYTRLSKLEPERASTLINGIADKAAGVFLWVHLVVLSLLEGLSNADRMSDLLARLEVLPPGLESLFDRLLSGLDPIYFKHACQLFRLVMARDRPLLLELWFADNEDHDSAMEAEIKTLSPDEVMDRLETMNRRLISRCKCFLEVESWHEDPSVGLSTHSYVRFIHRTAKDFLQSSDMWKTILNATGHDAFDPERHWANGFMGILKAVNTTSDAKWENFIWCIEYALMLENKLQSSFVDYLDEVSRAGMKNCEDYRTSKYVKRVGFDTIRRPPALQSFLDFAVWFNLVGYVRVKAKTASRDELLHATQFKGILWREQIEESWLAGKVMLTKAGFITDRSALKQVLSNSLQSKSSELRKEKWEKTKRRFFLKKVDASNTTSQETPKV
ncbi:uncharacterized protein BDZ99DRAFT_576168 [Mytilinidion resinicola]|uniref:NACHT domain-containing protein n=1 Tax=Mytilinidion resinicola TaxID=574789 RepID=A0A6A6Y3P0_9PEZI|nr:uncharacterized protein BDZ99DRAFT_576168 [Mytilinidion resinicola]KAF2803249.1 hypothetical protein BDZ99DRAFT_576168 [Mytilinidion resinicola]